VGTSADQVTNFAVKIRILPESYGTLTNKGNSSSPFKPGLSATVDIQTERTRGLVVPIQSVTIREEEKSKDSKVDGPAKDEEEQKKKDKTKPKAKEYVFVVEAGKVKQVEVKTGIQDDQNIIIISGLKVGQQVVSAPYAAISKMLKNDMAVEVVEKEKLFSTDKK
jgi:HlyD family secretion protein